MNAEDLANLIGWKTDAFHVALAAAAIGRIWHAAGGLKGITTRGGIVGMLRALLFGTNTPKDQTKP